MFGVVGVEFQQDRIVAFRFGACGSVFQVQGVNSRFEEDFFGHVDFGCLFSVQPETTGSGLGQCVTHQFDPYRIGFGGKPVEVVQVRKIDETFDLRPL